MLFFFCETLNTIVQVYTAYAEKIWRERERRERTSWIEWLFIWWFIKTVEYKSYYVTIKAKYITLCLYYTYLIKNIYQEPTAHSVLCQEQWEK